MAAADLRLNCTAPWPEGVRYVVSSQFSSSLFEHPRPCSLVKVTIVNSNDSIYFPCFSCSGFSTKTSYHNVFCQCLHDAVSNAVVLPTLSCAAAIAEDILHSVLIPANDFPATHGSTHIVQIRVIRNDDDDDDDDDSDDDDDDDSEYYDGDGDDNDDVNMVIGESFEEAGLQRNPCTIQSLIDMVMAKGELEALEGDKAEKDWKEAADDHNCTICMEEIESVWESLKMACSHIFHEKCLLEWLDDHYACPLCRFELPLEDCNDE